MPRALASKTQHIQVTSNDCGIFLKLLEETQMKTMRTFKSHVVLL